MRDVREVYRRLVDTVVVPAQSDMVHARHAADLVDVSHHVQLGRVLNGNPSILLYRTLTIEASILAGLGLPAPKR